METLKRVSDWRRHKGQTILEYSLMLAAVSLFALLLLDHFRPILQTTILELQNSLQNIVQKGNAEGKDLWSPENITTL